MNRTVFKDLKVDINKDSLQKLGQQRSSRIDYTKYIDDVNQVAKPKAIIKRVDVKVLSENETQIEGHVFTSKTLAEELKGQSEVFLYIATAGNEIKDTDRIRSDSIKDFFAGIVLMSSIEDVYKDIKQYFKTESIGYVNPGSLPDWDITNNITLCEMIGNISEIDVSLNDKGYMMPWNSISGIIYKK